MTAFRKDLRRLRHCMTHVLLAPACALLLSACVMDQTTPAAGTAATPTIGTDTEAMQARMDRLERDLANLRIDYSIVRPSMERLVSKETGLEQRLANIEAAFGPMTASISKPKKTAYTKIAPPKSAVKRTTPATTGNYGVHLASYKALENVEKGWAALKKDHKALLANLEPYVRDFNNSSKGGAYKRLIAGPIASNAQADKLCKKLKQSGVWCQAVSLGGRTK
ncbi:MAG: SPOR domain-containing protein [Kordiimonadaceae bacterium]|nr:SPOR domain-containing protein [Kordiimonadaceae bacterium]